LSTNHIDIIKKIKGQPSKSFDAAAGSAARVSATAAGHRHRRAGVSMATRRVRKMRAMPELRFATPSGELGGYLATPSGDGPHAGLVVIQDALGLSDDIRAQADRLTAAGYLAFAPDLYSGRGSSARSTRSALRTTSRSTRGPATTSSTA
jgi:hypothetical protein